MSGGMRWRGKTLSVGTCPSCSAAGSPTGHGGRRCGASSGDDDRRGGRPISGGPLDHHADPTVAEDGALAASRPGVKARERDVELEQAKAEVARLSAALKEMAVKLMLVDGKTAGAEWPGPTRRRCSCGEAGAAGGRCGGPASPTCRGCGCLPSTVRRVLTAQGLRLRPPPRPGRSVRKPFRTGSSTAPTRSGMEIPRPAADRSTAFSYLVTSGGDASAERRSPSSRLLGPGSVSPA